MKIGKLKLDVKDGIKKEWIITNGIGGYASSTVIGANTRKYHGLLVASLNTPTNRKLILSKLDENICVGGKNYCLYTNISKEYVSQGFKRLESFEKEYFPIFNYQVEDVKIEKKITMVYGKNTTIISYKIKNGRKKSTFTLAPIVNFRDIHSLTTDKEFEINQEIDGTKVKLIINDDEIPIYMYINDGKYEEHYKDTFKNMYYIKEEERGYFHEENLAVSGKFEINILPKEEKEINFIISLDKNDLTLDVNKIFETEKNRIDNIINNANVIKEKKKYTRQEKEKIQVIKDLIIASDSFIVNKKKLKSVIAGYPWFSDRGRDALIAFEGLFLVTKRFEEAKLFIKNIIKDLKSGIIPNVYSESNNKPIYNSADTSLLIFEAVNKYLEYTKDYDFIKLEVYEKLKNIIENYLKGTNFENNNIYVDTDNLLNVGTPTTQNTWMDAKIGEYVVTPRNGKVVEINALWYNALKTLENLAKKFDDVETVNYVKNIAKKHRESFKKNFYNAKKKCLYDVIGNDKIRPNQLFAISTTYPVINPKSEEAKNIFEVCTSKLLVSHGLKTLARGEIGYTPDYEGDCYKRDMSYHQGVTYPWLLGIYCNSFENILKAEKDAKTHDKLESQYEDFIEDVYIAYKKDIYAEDAIGTVSELYNSRLPYKAGGAYSQAWSVSEILRIILKRKK